MFPFKTHFCYDLIVFKKWKQIAYVRKCEVLYDDSIWHHLTLLIKIYQTKTVLNNTKAFLQMKRWKSGLMWNILHFVRTIHKILTVAWPFSIIMRIVTLISPSYQWKQSDKCQLKELHVVSGFYYETDKTCYKGNIVKYRITQLIYHCTYTNTLDATYIWQDNNLNAYKL